jgi:TolB-like protein/DNA-binding SARP family transcriptional activator/tetratricopeptide (TPR) repeat protein
MDAPMFSLTLLGGLSLEGEPGPVRGRAAQRHRMALLALLAASPGGAMSRDKLISCLWPEVDRERGRHLLSNSLYLLRQALGGAVTGTADALRLDPERLRCDVVEFEAALARGDLEAAVTLYAGPFLDGFFLADTPEFERWVDDQRDRLARKHGQALETLAAGLEAEGDHRRAAIQWRRLADQDPYSGRVTLRLMQALAAGGDVAGALQVARAHEARRRGDLEVEPDAEVLELGASLRRDAASGGQTPGAPAAPVAPAASTATAATMASMAPATSDTAPAPAPGGASPAPRPRDGAWRRRAMRSLPVAGLLLVAVVAVTVLPGVNAPAPIPSVAVLPFADLGSDPPAAYFADGVHEDVLAHLSRIGSLRVISRTSVLPYGTDRRNLRQIARELGVTHVVEGSVRREADRVLITAQLIDARTDHHLWAEQYHRNLADVFAVQGDIARQIAAALQVTLTPAEALRAGTPPTGDLTAYDLYLQALEYIQRYREPDHELGVGLLQRAILIDSTFARAHARLATARVVGVELHGHGREWLDTALASARTAVALDPDLAEAYHALGTAHVAVGDQGPARAALEQALALSPSFANPAVNLAALHGRAGRHDEAIKWHRHAAQLDPLGPMNLASLAWNYGALGMFREAEHTIERALTLRPDSRVAQRNAILLALLQGDHARAIRKSDLMVADAPDGPQGLVIAGYARVLARDPAAARPYLERAHALAPGAAWVVEVPVALGHALLETGDPERGRALLQGYVREALDEAAAQGWPGRHYSMAAAHALLGERAEALRWLRAMIDDGAGIHRLQLEDPLLDSLRGDPEFERLRITVRAALADMRRRVD